jgi:hypothetical protein
MKVGDLIEVTKCPINEDPRFECICFFCTNNSSRVGVVIEKLNHRSHVWRAMFDFGTWDVSRHNLFEGHVEVISEGG